MLRSSATEAVSTRVKTSHTGSLPRPEALIESGVLEPDVVTGAVVDLVRHPVEIGIDVVGDGEAGKPSYATYVVDRLAGFGGSEPVPPARGRADLEDFPSYRAWRAGRDAGGGGLPETLPVCTGPVSYAGHRLLAKQLADLSAATGVAGVELAFATAASPGLIERFMRNRYYASVTEYLGALADAMKVEYDAIVAAGFQLQIDCPDLTAGWNARTGDLAAHRRLVSERLEMIDHATRDIPPERIRLHICWGNYEGPHHHDIPLVDIIDLLVGARPGALSFEAANPRHEHEWEIFESRPIPDDQVLIPGVLDSTTNYIEHPRLVAQRIGRYTRLVGSDRVLAGTDCGFATFGVSGSVAPDIAWAKLATLAEGADLAAGA
jgi:5-methyltetrahydropteroyltriglutamate--homocysteine methyltransferase